MKQTPRKIYATHAEYIDPGDCDSFVGYNITSSKYYRAALELADCNRKIQWYFENDAASLHKIDRAIAVLTKFRAELVKSHQQFKNRRKRK